MSAVRCAAVALFAVLLLAACGNKGDLVMPPPKPAKPATPPPAPTPDTTPKPSP